MNRRRFLKLFGLGVAEIAIAKIVIDETKKPFVTDGYTVKRELTHGVFIKDPARLAHLGNGTGIMEQIRESNTRHYTMLTGEKGQKAFNKAIAEYTKYYING